MSKETQNSTPNLPSEDSQEQTEQEQARQDKHFIPCLNHGFVRLVDVMGDDSAIVQAARVSYGKGTKKLHTDRGLIRYLLRHAHTTPFEMVEFKFHIKLPIFIARQWIRHRTANVNEISGRYSVMKDEFYVPTPENIRPQSQTNRQGRSEEQFEDAQAAEFASMLDASQQNAYKEYEHLLDNDVAREISRINLPLSLYTEWYWKIDLHNLFHFLRLRIDSHAQYEIRVFGEAMAQIVKEIVPMAWEAFEDYTLHALRLTRLDILALKELLGDKLHEDIDDEMLKSTGLKRREAEEFKAKLHIIRNMEK